MRQALILGARPLFSCGKPFPKVPLGEGGWKIEMENVDDSKVRITILKKSAASNGTFMVPSVVEMTKDSDVPLVEGPAIVSAEVMEAGREDHIRVFAVKL